jgi:hypothetical protein
MDSTEFTLSVVEWAHHKFANEVAVAIGFDRLTTSVFGDYVVAVIEVRGGVAIDCLFDSPAGRVPSAALRTGVFVGDGAPVCRIVTWT